MDDTSWVAIDLSKPQVQEVFEVGEKKADSKAFQCFIRFLVVHRRDVLDTEQKNNTYSGLRVDCTIPKVTGLYGPLQRF